VELEDEGLEGGLNTEVHNLLVQDVNDQDPLAEPKGAPAAAARLVIPRHHKKLGTFPLCRIPGGFLPATPALTRVTFAQGEKKGDVWVNRETGLIYDMAQWYADDMPEAGAVIELKKTDKADEFEFVYAEKTDKFAHVSAARIEELEELAKEASNLSTLDLVLRLMRYHNKGVSYITLFTEMNIVRRTTRRLVASILSSYYGFVQRAKSDLWYLDEKKIDQGFKKVKKKYIRK
jgi:hypothetical protein